jgi:arginine-tRNA-protein transferase
MTSREKAPEIYLSMPHSCSYLPGRAATTLFVDPRYAMDSAKFGRFMQLGWRRSGDLVYRPHCHHCTACVPVRIPVSRFTPGRGQRRVWRRNHDVEIRPRRPEFDAEHFALYQRYQQSRHPGGGMDEVDPQKYLEFLVGRHVETMFYEMRLGSRLLGVAVVDHLPDGLSAVYTFFDPQEKARAPGVYAVLWEAGQAQRLGLPYLYLGYWIRESPKMAYKVNYQPLEAYQGGCWIPLDPPGNSE